MNTGRGLGAPFDSTFLCHSTVVQHNTYIKHTKHNLWEGAGAFGHKNSAVRLVTKTVQCVWSQSQCSVFVFTGMIPRDTTADLCARRPRVGYGARVRDVPQQFHLHGKAVSCV